MRDLLNPKTEMHISSVYFTNISTYGGSILYSRVSVFFFSSTSSPVRLATNSSRMLAYFSNFCIMLSTMLNFLQGKNGSKLEALLITIHTGGSNGGEKAMTVAAVSAAAVTAAAVMVESVVVIGVVVWL